MELKYLNTFKTILEAGSYLKAAEKLNYTQSTVTFQMQQLEQELSIQLFEKIGRRMVLTQAGRQVLPLVDDILQSVQQLQAYGKDVSELKGTLRVAIPETLLGYRMQPVLRVFREAAPHVTLALQCHNCHLIKEQVKNGEVDVGIHYDVGDFGGAAVTELLTRYPMVLVASPDLPERDRDFVTPCQVSGVSLIYSEPGSISYQVMADYLAEKEIAIAGKLELGSTEAIKKSVAANLGVALLPAFTVEQELESDLLQQLPTDLTQPAAAVMVTYHKNKWISPAMELFIRLVREDFAAGRKGC